MITANTDYIEKGINDGEATAAVLGDFLQELQRCVFRGSALG